MRSVTNAISAIACAPSMKLIATRSGPPAPTRNIYVAPTIALGTARAAAQPCGFNPVVVQQEALDGVDQSLLSGVGMTVS
jgi:hypothetical protein